MAEEEIEKIKKLPPEERIKKLKEIEEKRKKEIEQAKELVKASIEEITKKEEETFTKEEALKEEIKQIKTSLEETVAQEEPKIKEEQLESHRDYIRHLREDLTARDLYFLAKNLAQNVQDRGYLSNQQQEMLNDLERVQQYKQKDIESGKYKLASEEILDILNAVKNTIDVLKHKYLK